MTVTAVAAEELLAAQLHAEPDQMQDAEPDGDAPEQAHRQAEVRSPAVPLGLRIHSVTALSSIFVLQIAWLAALGYGAYRLLH